MDPFAPGTAPIDTAAAPHPASEKSPDELVLSHMSLVRALASRFYRMRWDNTVPYEEYCQMGAVGLVEAARRYDPERGAQFSTYATWRITGAILNGLEHSTERHEQIAARQRAIRDRTESLAAEPLPGKQESSLEAALARLSAAAIGLAVGFMLEGSGMYAEESSVTHVDGYRSLASSRLQRRLRKTVKSLPGHERTVMERHYFQQHSFTDIASDLGLTKGRISQIHRGAVERLRNVLRDDMIGFDG